MSKTNQELKIKNMSDEEFKKVMKFYGDHDDIWLSKMRLMNQIQKSAILNDFLQLIRDAMKAELSVTPYNLPKSYKDVFMSFGNYTGFFDTSSNLSYIYNCHSLGSCNVSIISK